MLNFQKKKSLTSSAECTKNIIKFMIFQGAAAPVYGAAALVFYGFCLVKAFAYECEI